jgi:hypothetical protein
VELIVAASAEFERVVRQLPADSWDRPTPSTFSVRELVEHLVVGNRFTALLLAGVDRDEARTLLAGDQVGRRRLGTKPSAFAATGGVPGERRRPRCCLPAVPSGRPSRYTSTMRAGA